MGYGGDYQITQPYIRDKKYLKALFLNLQRGKRMEIM